MAHSTGAQMKLITPARPTAKPQSVSERKVLPKSTVSLFAMTVLAKKMGSKPTAVVMYAELAQSYMHQPKMLFGSSFPMICGAACDIQRRITAEEGTDATWLWS